jgi:hypothetical protein
METKVTRRGDNWLFFLEARVSYHYVFKDPETESRVVMKKMAEIANAIFDDVLAAGKCRRASETHALLAWDKSDPNTAGHPWAEPDVRDDFPGFCCYPGCDQRSLHLKPVCVEHLKEVCLDCGWVKLPNSGCKCDKTEAQVELELKKRHPRKPLEMTTPCEHSPVPGKTDCAACRISRAGKPTPCDQIAEEAEKGK